MKKKKSKNILVIDDEKDLLELFTRVLKSYPVETAQNEKEAFEKLAAQNFAVIFLDVVMPGVDFMEHFKTIRKMQPKAKILLMTGFAVEDQINRALELGAVGVMYKPMEHINDIEEAVKRVLK